jgi:hypothetical protein
MDVWVYLMMVPSINVTDNGCNAFSLWIHGASNARKFPVAPESKMAELHKLLGGVELRYFVIMLTWVAILTFPLLKGTQNPCVAANDVGLGGC